MFKKKRPLQSKSEIVLRNIVVIFLVAYMSVFLLIPIIMAFAGSFHLWNPLNGTYEWIGLDITSACFSIPPSGPLWLIRLCSAWW